MTDSKKLTNDQDSPIHALLGEAKRAAFDEPLKWSDNPDIPNMGKVIADALYILPPDARLAALADARRRIAERDAGMHHGFVNLEPVYRMKSVIVQRFVRDITNNHSSEDADKLLFRHQELGSGSRQLWDYLCNMPSIRK